MTKRTLCEFLLYVKQDGILSPGSFKTVCTIVLLWSVRI